ncbi:hypothetical protein ES703_08278 [subsurface metagenome]
MILESSFAKTAPTIIREQYSSDPLQTSVLDDGWFEKSKDQVDGRFSQGVANDGVFWYFSSRGGLYKTDANFNMLIEKDGTQNPIPGFLRDQGYDHIGDIACFGGKIYAPIEDVSYVKPIIGIYDADSLNFTGEFVQVPQSHIPWIAVDPRTGYFYSSEFSGVNKLFVYDPDQNFAIIDTVYLDRTLARVQGGAFHGDSLYLACDNGDYVYEVGVASGTVTTIIIVPNGPEMEGIEAYNLDSGVLHFVAETGGSTNIFYHYDKLLAHDVRVSSITSPEPKMPILMEITPMATIQNIGTNTEQTFNASCVIDTAGVEIYWDTQIVSNITSLDTMNISFATWMPTVATGYTFVFFTELSSDLNTSNDTIRFKMEASNTIDDFESGVERWNLGSGWELAIGRNNTRGIATTPRPYQNNTDSPLSYLQPFNLSIFDSAASVNLRLWTKNRLEEGKDFLYVEASANGSNWSQLGRFTGRQEDWIQTFHSLSSFCGPGNDNIRIRFRLVTDSSGTDSGVRIDDVGIFFSIEEEEIPKVFNLSQNYPNPFNLSTTLKFDLPSAADIKVIVYDLLGREVVRLVDKRQEAGYHLLVWDGRDARGRGLPSSIYIARLSTPQYTRSIKMVLLK